jgi:hypothetical protein
VLLSMQAGDEQVTAYKSKGLGVSHVIHEGGRKKGASTATISYRINRSINGVSIVSTMLQHSYESLTYNTTGHLLSHTATGPRGCR